MIKQRKKAIRTKRINQENTFFAVHKSVSLTAPANNSLVHIACLVFLILLIYGNTLNAPFQWDENVFIVGNPIIKDLHKRGQRENAYRELNEALKINPNDQTAQQMIKEVSRPLH